MELIERYLQEIGRRLPHKQRADILSELRSSLMDTLEARFGSDPNDDAVISVIKEMGSPKKVAESYHPEGQYLIGPALYPTFKLVLGVVFTVIISLQLVTVTISLGLTPGSVSLLDEFWNIISALPTAVGIVVLIFILLERSEESLRLNSETKTEVFDPRKLPKLERDDVAISQGEQVFGIIVGVSILAILARFVVEGGFTGIGVFANPVIDQYFPWIGLSMVLSIVIDIILLWRGRWQVSTRLAKIGANMISLVLLFLLIQGHNAWLSEMGVTSFLWELSQLPENSELASQVVGMIFFRLSLIIAFIATAIEVVVQLYRFVRARMNTNVTKQVGLVSVSR